MTSKQFDETKAKIAEKVAEGKWDLDYVKLAVEELIHERNTGTRYRVRFDKRENVDSTVREFPCVRSSNHAPHIWETRTLKRTNPYTVAITRFQCPGSWQEEQEPTERVKVPDSAKERLQDAAQRVKERARQTRRGTDLGGAFSSVMESVGDALDSLGDVLDDFFR